MKKENTKVTEVKKDAPEKAMKITKSYIYAGVTFNPGDEKKLKGEALTAVMKKEGE
jgi:hypothetical protein